MEIREFLTKFEARIIEKGIKEGIFTSRRMVSVKTGKLARTPFGRTVGMVINSELPFVLDIYGHQKKSKGFWDEAARIKQYSRQSPLLIPVWVVHFESVKDKHFYKLCPDDPAFLGEFLMKKQILINLRWNVQNQRRP